jgi:hypothetical protein
VPTTSRLGLILLALAVVGSATILLLRHRR